jgi:hypothetical protein
LGSAYDVRGEQLLSRIYNGVNDPGYHGEKVRGERYLPVDQSAYKVQEVSLLKDKLCVYGIVITNEVPKDPNSQMKDVIPIDVRILLVFN